jgi:hypothetical protein
MVNSFGQKKRPMQNAIGQFVGEKKPAEAGCWVGIAT